MLIDLHCHTRPQSMCSALTPAALVELALERGLDGVCLTEHDRLWEEAELTSLQATSGIAVFAGVEITTDRGHILAFGLCQLPAAAGDFAALAAVAAIDGALLYLAHPARDGLLRLDPPLLAGLASVEAVNGSDSKLQDLSSGGLTGQFALPGIGGSDAHTAAEVARGATRFTDHIDSTAELVEALRLGRYQAERLA